MLSCHPRTLRDNPRPGSRPLARKTPFLGILGLGAVAASLFAGAPRSAAPPGSVDPPAETASEAPAALEAGAGERPVLLARIDGDIGLVTSAYVRRLLEQAREKNAEAVVIELNTFGGRLDAAVAIRDALLDAPATTAVFINKRAISAGALISLACDRIAISPGGTIGAATPVQTAPGSEVAEPVGEKYVSYFRQEMRSTAETKGRNGDIAEAMVDLDKEIEGVSEEGKLLTLTTQSALEHGIADFEASSLDEVLEKLEIRGPREEVAFTWSEHLVAFLTSPAIASLLFMGLLVCGYLEYQTPGFGFFGFGAISCFAILFFSHYLVNLAGWEELLLFVVGMVLIAIEIFVTPGFGVLGGLGLLSILASAILLFMAGDFGDFHFDNPFTLTAIYRVLLSAVLGLAVVLLLIRFLPRGVGPAGRLVLATTLSTAGGYTSHEAASVEEAEPLEGATGRALTPLRPAGRAALAGKRHDVETEGDFVEKGEAVRFLRREGGRILVRRI